jgi:hypothetical protein
MRKLAGDPNDMVGWTLIARRTSCLLANDVEGLFVRAEPKEDGMAHLGFTRPLGKLYLAQSLGISHVVAFSSFTFWSKGFLSVRSGCIAS